MIKDKIKITKSWIRNIKVNVPYNQMYIKRLKGFNYSFISSIFVLNAHTIPEWKYVYPLGVDMNILSVI